MTQEDLCSCFCDSGNNLHVNDLRGLTHRDIRKHTSAAGCRKHADSIGSHNRCRVSGSFFMQNLPESWDSDLQWLGWGSVFINLVDVGHRDRTPSPLWQRHYPWCPLQCRSWRSNSGCQDWFLPISLTHRPRLSFAAVQTRLALNRETSSCFCFPHAGIIGLCYCSLCTIEAESCFIANGSSKLTVQTRLASSCLSFPSKAYRIKSPGLALEHWCLDGGFPCFQHFLLALLTSSSASFLHCPVFQSEIVARKPL